MGGQVVNNKVISHDILIQQRWGSPLHIFRGFRSQFSNHDTSTCIYFNASSNSMDPDEMLQYPK